MKLFLITSTALIAGVNTLVVYDSRCNFKLAAAGGASGQISQLGDGQNRVGASGLPVATYSIGADGGILDQNGRGCILTPPTTQLQCDAGASPTAGFSIGCDGTMSYNGKSHFVACQTGDNGWNIYSTAGPGQTGCVNITLVADSCHPGCPSVQPSSPALPSESLPSPPPASKTCPADPTRAFEFPHLIIPVSSKNPDKAYGTSYNGQVSRSDIRSFFNFDIPASYAGKICSLVFFFPRQDQLVTSSFAISGDAKVGFASLAGIVNQATTHANAPGVAKDYGIFDMQPGTSHVVATFDCQAGTTQSYSMAAPDTDFLYFQDYNPPP